jgi:hypothetical protein
MLRLDRNRATRFPIFYSGSLAGESGSQPGAREPPLAVGGPEQYSQRPGRLVQGHPGEEPQLHDLGGLGIAPGEAAEGVVECEEVVVRRPGGVGEPVEIDPVRAAAPLQARPVAAPNCNL